MLISFTMNAYGICCLFSVRNGELIAFSNSSLKNTSEHENKIYFAPKILLEDGAGINRNTKKFEILDGLAEAHSVCLVVGYTKRE